MHRELAALPRPRKHYQWYYSTREANADMWHAPQGVHDFLRAYYHHKSADWKDNQPHPLRSWSASELAKLPTYYVMDLASNMAETVAEEMPSAEPRSPPTNGCPTRELAFYSAEYARTGFQGGLQWYRCGTSGAFIAGVANLVRPHHRRALLLHLGQQRLGHLSAARRLRGDAGDAPARACSAVIWSTAPGTGCSRSSRMQVSRLLLQFLKQVRKPRDLIGSLLT